MANEYTRVSVAWALIPATLAFVQARRSVINVTCAAGRCDVARRSAYSTLRLCAFEYRGVCIRGRSRFHRAGQQSAEVGDGETDAIQISLHRNAGNGARK